MRKQGLVTFLSDYGLEDEFVGICHGVMLMINSELKIVDIHHQILRQNIRHGAMVLRQSVRYMPEAAHLAVVDPTVGSDRKAVAIETAWGHAFVGPDNGLLMPAVEVCGGASGAFELTDARFFLTPVSRTFQGRDIFAPVVAHVASGVPLSELGPRIKVDELVSLEIPEAWVHDDHVHAEVLQLDRFGNLQLNVSPTHLEQIGLSRGKTLEIRIEGHRVQAPFAITFADVEPGELVVVEDSYGWLSLSVNNGDAAERLRADAGSTAIVGSPLH